MSDLKTAAAGAVVVSEGVSVKVGTEDRKRAGRKAKPINVKALQAAVDRAEKDGPLSGLGALYEAVAADEAYNIAMDGVAPIAKRIKTAMELGLTVKTQAAPKGRPADPDKETDEGISEECAAEMRKAYAGFAHPATLELWLADAKAGKKRKVRFFSMLEQLMHEPEVEVVAPSA